MIMPSHTTTNPKTVMIKSFNTNLTFSAMFCPIVTGYIAYLAEYLLRFLRTQQTGLAFIILNSLLDLF
jgi:hypothetical protein